MGLAETHTFVDARLDKRLHDFERACLPGAVTRHVFRRLWDVNPDGDVLELARGVEYAGVHLVEGSVVILG